MYIDMIEIIEAISPATNLALLSVIGTSVVYVSINIDISIIDTVDANIIIMTSLGLQFFIFLSL